MMNPCWNHRRWLLLGLFLVLVAWVARSEGACNHYGHACLGAHGKKRSSEPAEQDPSIILRSLLTPYVAQEQQPPLRQNTEQFYEFAPAFSSKNRNQDSLPDDYQ